MQAKPGSNLMQNIIDKQNLQRHAHKAPVLGGEGSAGISEEEYGPLVDRLQQNQSNLSVAPQFSSVMSLKPPM